MRALPLFLLAVAAPAWCQDDGPRFCPNRPSLGESGCTTERGHVQLEMSSIDWTRDTVDGVRDDTMLVGDFQARLGVTQSAELQVAWTPFGDDRTRDATRRVSHRARIGDVQVGLRQNLMNPDGKGLSFAIEPSLTLPVGRGPIGADTWSAGLVLPITYDLSKTVNLGLTSDAEAAANADGHGRHLLIDEVLGLSVALSDAVTVVGEAQLIRDEEPSDPVTQLFAAGSVAWQPTKRTQLDLLVGAGLNRAAPDLRVLTGGAVVF